MANNTGLSAMERTISCETRFCGGKAEEQVRALHAVREAPQIFLLREFQLVFGQIRALLVR